VLDDSLEKHPEGIWLAQHAWEFGFVLSYPDGKEAITGYRYEPWHFRYVGEAAARTITFSGLTSTELLRNHQTIGDDLPPPQRPPHPPGGCRLSGPIDSGC
ncbi:MAG: D-alanyl-D-alanine carboxypeptidase family protein, partial [Dehalococcoidia bacterium]